MTIYPVAKKPAQQTLTIILIKISIASNNPTAMRSATMYVCLCQGVTDTHIREAIYEGCCNYREVRESTGVGTQCGKCACLAKQVVRETLGELQSAQSMNYSLAYAAS